MRILKIELLGILQPKSEGLDLASEAVQAQLYRELDALRLDLADRMRARAAIYLPGDYSVFVRVDFERTGNKVHATFWIDDPAVSGVTGLLARRAWSLSVPILSHVFREAVQERLQTLTVAVQDNKPRISAFAPARAWYSPLAIAAAMALATTLYWVFAHAALVGALRRALG